MSGDQRVRTARETLGFYDRGTWTEANVMNIVGHLASAARMLLEVVDEQASSSASRAGRAGHPER